MIINLKDIYIIYFYKYLINNKYIKSFKKTILFCIKIRKL